MLSAIRNKSKGWVAYVVVGFITIPFVLFGIQDYLGGSSNTSIATVDGEDVDINVYYQELNKRQSNLQQQFGSAYTQEIDNALKQTVLDLMINEKLLENFANSLGVVTINNEVRSEIEMEQAFQDDGVFSEVRYNQILGLNGYSPAAYELAISKALSREQIKRNLGNSAFISTIQIDQLNDLVSQQRDVSYIPLNTKDFENKAAVSQNEISDYFNDNRSSFIEGQKVKVNFVELSLGDMEEPSSPDEETLQSLYDDNSELYTNPERRRTQHILVESENLANDLLEQINQGADFDELANANSVDTSSNEKGGDLGFNEKGLIGVEFDEAAFSMNIDDVSEVVSTDYGYFHIIKLTDIEVETVQSFDDVQDQLVALNKNNVTKKMLFDLLEDFTSLAYEESLDMVADQFGLELQTSDYFANGSQEYDDAFVSAAFSDAVINEGENSEVIELSAEKFAVLALSSSQPAREKELNEVEDQVISILSNIAAKKIIDNLSLSIATALASGDELMTNKLINDNALEWNNEGWISRAKELPFDVTSIAFSIPKPIDGEHTYSSRSIDGFTSLVIDIAGVRLPEEDTDTGVSSLLISQENNEMFVSLIKQLRENAEIRIFSDLL
ncbi:SurA N-terminal domain-containing protein [Candidatus Thioglobus sp.]|nr:SurA N-terminal domain-containing protein [Candidatus Thioglobus sp.]MDB4099438.1 SurA N-terminal domain-containing protein [Candidatus Thioglobus sp.]